MPSMPGIIKSVKTTAKSSRQNSSSASSAEVKQQGAVVAQPEVRLQQIAHAPLVVDNEDSRFHGLAPAGKKTTKQLPAPGRLLTSIQPPCS